MTGRAATRYLCFCVYTRMWHMESESGAREAPQIGFLAGSRRSFSIWQHQVLLYRGTEGRLDKLP